MKEIITAILCVFCMQIGFTQTTTEEPLSIVKNLIGYEVYHDGEVLNIAQLSKIIKTNTEAYNQFCKAKVMSDFGIVFGSIGGFFIGWPIGGVLVGAPFNWKIFAIGVGFISICVPLCVVADGKIKKSVEIYNADINAKKPISRSYELKLGTTSDGMGIVLQF